MDKRIIKRPKLYFYDTGLICYLTGVTSKDLLEKGLLSGSVFENYIDPEITARYRMIENIRKIFDTYKKDEYDSYHE